MKANRVFIHGLESSSLGTKARYFSRNYPDMLIGDFTGSFENRMKDLRALLKGRRKLVLVGSSYGGLMAAVYAFENPAAVNRLVLLAPALNLENFDDCRSRTLNAPVAVFHGTRDDVVPPLEVEQISRKVFPNLQFTFLPDGHQLQDTFPALDWKSLLEPY